MKPDKRLLTALAEKLANYRASIPVFPIRERSLDELHTNLIDSGLRFGKMAGLAAMRHNLQHHEHRTDIQFQEGIHARVFHASGAMTLHRGWRPMEKMITAYAERADLQLLQRQTEAAIKSLDWVQRTRLENFRFERLWRVKASGITPDGKVGPVALTRVVGAFRRYIGELPVWGRASMFVELAAESQLAAAGIDWRPIASRPLDEAKVVSPEEGAIRVLSELQTFLPGKVITRKEYVPEFFSLGYFSLPKRRAQMVMQPVFVAMFRPTGPIPSTGRLIVVPAGVRAYESIARSIVSPPLASPRQQSRKTAVKRQPRK